MDLEKAFTINISINFSGKSPQKKKKKLEDAYEEYLKGNLQESSYENKQSILSKLDELKPRTFASQG